MLAVRLPGGVFCLRGFLKALKTRGKRAVEVSGTCRKNAENARENAGGHKTEKRRKNKGCAGCCGNIFRNIVFMEAGEC